MSEYEDSGVGALLVAILQSYILPQHSSVVAHNLIPELLP